MPNSIAKQTYVKARKAYTSPIQLMYVLYNMHCDTHKKVPSIGKFEGYFQIWLGNNGYKLMQGTLIIRNYLDKKFG